VRAASFFALATYDMNVRRIKQFPVQVFAFEFIARIASIALLDAVARSHNHVWEIRPSNGKMTTIATARLYEYLHVFCRIYHEHPYNPINIIEEPPRSCISHPTRCIMPSTPTQSNQAPSHKSSPSISLYKPPTSHPPHHSIPLLPHRSAAAG